MLDSSTTTDHTLAQAGRRPDFRSGHGRRLGVTATQPTPSGCWNVNRSRSPRRPAAGLGSQVKVSLESDINSAERMPFPVKQQTADASLRYTISQAAVFIVGGSRRDRRRLHHHGRRRAPDPDLLLLLSFGFQAGQDSPHEERHLGFL